MRRPRCVLMLALPALLGPVACADEADSPTPAGAGTASITGGLALLPDDREDETIVWGDLSRAAQLAGVERPEDAGDTDAVIDYVNRITGIGPSPDEPSPVAVLPPEAANVQRLAQVGEFEDEVGWSIVDVDGFVERATPPDAITVMDGDFDTGRIEDAIGASAGGAWVLGNPDGSMNLNDVSAARPLGETVWMAEVGDGLTVSRGSDHNGDVRAAAGGEPNGPTLADDEGLAALAGALDAQNAYGAMLVRPGMEASSLQTATPESAETMCDNMLAEPPVATATAIADDEGPVVLIAHAHASADEAEANAAALERIAEEGVSLQGNRPWTDMLALDGVEVTGPSDTVVVGRFRPEGEARAAMWYRVITQQDTLVTYC